MSDKCQTCKGSGVIDDRPDGPACARCPDCQGTGALTLTAAQAVTLTQDAIRTKAERENALALSQAYQRLVSAASSGNYNTWIPTNTHVNARLMEQGYRIHVDDKVTEVSWCRSANS